MLAATGMKLGTCWIGFAQGWLATPEGHAVIGLREDLLPVAPIIVGHAKAPMPAIERKEPQVDWIR